MRARGISEAKIRELHRVVKQIDTSVRRARVKAEKMELLSAAKTLEACGAIIDRLLESLSAPFDEG